MQVRMTPHGVAARRVKRLLIAATALCAASTAARAETVHFTVDATKNVHTISRYIYGINETNIGGSKWPNVTFRRVGGNRWTAYNWVNNASNAGSDFEYQNDDFLGGGSTPGGAVIPAIKNAAASRAGLLLTVPIQGYVAADKDGNGDVRKTPNYLNVRFHKERSRKGSAFTLKPDPQLSTVYQDEFVNWVKVKYPSSLSSSTPIWFSLDNEPDLWSDTHAEVHPKKVTYAELIAKAIDYAGAIKAVMPKALVFGPVNYGFNGYVNLQDAPDASGDFQVAYLRKLKAASASAGKRLLDVLDVHWYPEATDASGKVRITEQSTSAAVVKARLQAPRSLWDPTYIETSWIAQDWYGNAAVKLLPRLFAKISSNFPGTKLAFTEYNYGAGHHISGGIAQADVLGVFGREGVFAANEFPLDDNESFIQGGMKMYRDFDGKNATFGNTSISAVSDNVRDSSVYASLDSADSSRLVVVAINKTASSVTTVIKLNHAKPMKHAKVYQLTSASPNPKLKTTLTLTNHAQFTYVMPAYSVSTIALSTK
jgi:hypothetical protein